MLTVQNTTNTIYEIKKSKFISYLTPYNQFFETIQSLKKNNPKARHFVYAYRYLNEFNQIIENSSDDGEPKGTSGKPTLAVLAGQNLINIAIITVRYFGGTKLGTGGLVRAYSDATNLVISNTTLIEYKKLESYIINLEYSSLQRHEYILNKLDIKITDKVFEDNIKLKIECTKKSYDEFLKLL